MIEIKSKEYLNVVMNDTSIIFIHTPFCGTCQLARKMLTTIEAIDENKRIHEMNASFFPDFMQEYKIESVPCLLLVSNGAVSEKIYAFRSVPHLVSCMEGY